MKKLILLSIFIVSCVHTTRFENKRISEKDYAIYFIDTFLSKGISFDEVKSMLKKPDEIDKSEDSTKIYRYEDKIDKLSKWSFGVDDKGMVDWLAYHPRSNPLLDRVEILPNTLKRYNCEKKIEIDEADDGHYIDEITFFECAEGRMRAYYNIHGEIRYIAITREKP